MSRQKNHEHKCSFLRVTTERNRYFTGKYMAARDFHADQEYFLDRQRLQNQLTLGWGIACGLQVRPHRKDECADSWVEIGPGLAIDCCGREVILTHGATFEFKVPNGTGISAWEERESPDGCEDQSPDQKEHRHAGHTDTPEQIPCPKPSEPRRFLLCVHYCEQKIEPVPALYADGACCEQTKEANRIREAPKFCLVPWTHELSMCWPIDDEEARADPYSPCDKQKYQTDSSCGDRPDDDMSCDPYCPCGTYVPLALITAHYVDKKEHRIVGYDIDLSKRKYIHAPAEGLTKIVRTNWPHGRRVAIDELQLPSHFEDEEELRDCRNHPVLWLRFSRRLSCECNRREEDPNPSFGHGVNEHTVTVEHHDDGQPPTVLIPDKVVLCADHQTAVIVLPADSPKYLDNDFVIVTVECDFIEDCNGRPIDGDFLRGRLPTGNGVAGGTFQSWFRIIRSDSKQESY